jgi:peptide/nickel transport system substrate-binding protein
MRFDRIRATRRQAARGGLGVVASGVLAGGRGGDARAEERVLRLRVVKDIAVIDPLNVRNTSENDVMTAVSNKLITYKPSTDWAWELDAAESMEQIDDVRIRFRLRPGIRWTNGFGEVTADDVKFSYERVSNPANEGSNVSDWTLFDHVDVEDTYTGVIVFKEPYPAAWLSLFPRPSATITSRAAVEKAGGKFTTEPPATSGPYVIAEFTMKERLVLVRNPGWTGPKPDFDRIEMIQIDDDKAAEIAFEAGEIDYTDISVSSLVAFEQDMPEHAKLDVRPAVGIEWLGMNTEVAPLDDVRVRRAVQLAVDIPAVLEAGYQGAAEVAMGLVPPGIVGHRDRRLYPERDLDQARRLLAEAGFANGVETTLAVINNTDRVSMAQVIQANLAEAGIEVEVIPYESGRWWTLGLESEGEEWKTLQMYLARWGMAPDPGSMTQWFTKEQIGIWNWERWNNEEFNELHIAALKELDPEKRGAMYVRMQDLMEESGAYVWLTNGLNAKIYRDTLVPATSADGRLLLLPRFKSVA